MGKYVKNHKRGDMGTLYCCCDDSHISTIILVTGFGIELSECLALHSEKQSNCVECACNLLTQFLFARARVACHHNNNRVARKNRFHLRLY
jgi:hypothetical protein